MEPPKLTHGRRVLALWGEAGAGKSTAAHLLGNLMPQATTVKFAGPLKAMLRAFYEVQGLDPEEIQRRIEGDLKEEPCRYLKGRTPRHAMETLGEQWGRELIHAEVWVSAWKDSAASILNSHPSATVLVDDMRYPNEEDAVRELGGDIVAIHNPNPRRAKSSHGSAQYVPDADEVIVNDKDLPTFHHKVMTTLTTE